MNNKIFKIAFASFLALNLTSCLAAVIGGAGLATYTIAQERTVGEAINDATIEGKLMALYLGHNNQKSFMDIGVESVEGRVLLTGDVPSREAKIEAYNIAWQHNAVKEVINELQVKEEHQFSAKQLAKDTWISTQARSSLLFSKNVASRNYSVETIDNVVYLMGIARDKEELDKVTEISSQVSGVERVVSYVRLKGSKKAEQMRKQAEQQIGNPNPNQIDVLESSAKEAYGENANKIQSQNLKPIEQKVKKFDPSKIKIVDGDDPIIIEDISKDYNSATDNNVINKAKEVIEENSSENLKYYRKPLLEDLPES